MVHPSPLQSMPFDKELNTAVKKESKQKNLNDYISLRYSYLDKIHVTEKRQYGTIENRLCSRPPRTIRRRLGFKNATPLLGQFPPQPLNGNNRS
jgi:hypothetical protein